MKHKDFIEKLDDDRIVAAIAEAEKKTTGEIRVFIAKRAVPDPVAAAEKQFTALGMTKTKHRNAILILLAPKSQTFAIFGDKAIHEKCGPDFWSTLRDEMKVHLKQAHHTQAIVHTITRAGALLAEHFPAKPGDNPNEQPDTIIRG